MPPVVVHSGTDEGDEMVGLVVFVFQRRTALFGGMETGRASRGQFSQSEYPLDGPWFSGCGTRLGAKPSLFIGNASVE